MSTRVQDFHLEPYLAPVTAADRRAFQSKTLSKAIEGSFQHIGYIKVKATGELLDVRRVDSPGRANFLFFLSGTTDQCGSVIMAIQERSVLITQIDSPTKEVPARHVATQLAVEHSRALGGQGRVMLRDAESVTDGDELGFREVVAVERGRWVKALSQQAIINWTTLIGNHPILDDDRGVALPAVSVPVQLRQSSSNQRLIFCLGILALLAAIAITVPLVLRARRVL
jgi:hypothetical protein